MDTPHGWTTTLEAVYGISCTPKCLQPFVDKAWGRSWLKKRMHTCVSMKSNLCPFVRIFKRWLSVMNSRLHGNDESFLESRT